MSTRRCINGTMRQSSRHPERWEPAQRVMQGSPTGNTFAAWRSFASLRMTALLLGVTTLQLFLTGCGPTKMQRQADLAVTDYLQGSFSESVNQLRPLAKTPNEDFVLNNCRLGSAALANYDLDQAEQAFLQAIEVINSVGVNQGGRTFGA